MFGQGPRMPFRQRLAQFFYGRNGPDAFYNFLVIACLCFAFINLFVHHWICSLLELGLLGYAIFRMLSKNVWKRRKENQKFLNVWVGVKRFFARMQARIKNRKTNAYRKCPNCKNVLCLPKVKGTHSVTCPVCHNHFDVHI